MQQREPHRVVVDELDRLAGQRHRASELADQVRVLGRAGEYLGAVGAGALLGVVDLIPDLERVLEKAVSLGECVDLLRGPARGDRGAERLGEPLRLPPVVGYLRRCAGPTLAQRRVRLQRLGELGVQLGALAGEHVGGHRLAHQRVTEAVVVAVLNQDVARDRLAQRLVELGAAELAYLREQRMADVAPGGGRHPQDVARLLRQRLDPDHQRVAECRRDLGALGRRRDQLLGEERVAVGALEHVPDQRLARLLAEDRDQEPAELLARKRSQVDPLDDGSAIELRHERPQGVATMKLVAAVGADEQQPRVVRVANQEGEKVPGGAIGPVQVLDREHDRPGLAEAGEQREQDLEQARLCERLVEGRVAADPALAGVAELGQQPCELLAPGQGVQLGRAELARQRPQRRGERGEGQLALGQLDAVAGEHATRRRSPHGARARRPAGSCRPRPRRRSGSRRTPPSRLARERR